MRRISIRRSLFLALTLLVTAPAVPLRVDGALAASSPPIGVRAALALCQHYPATHHLSLRGWFIPGTGRTDEIDGELFESPETVPLTTVDQLDVAGHWKRYGAIFAHIRTHASFAARRLILHGTLDCRSAEFQTDRDPFPPPTLVPSYGSLTGPGIGAITTSVVAGGLKLTLTVPRRSYPRNALALVTVSMQNVSTHAIGYFDSYYRIPGISVPQVQVLDSSGRIVFPPAMPYAPPLPGPAPSIVPLESGQTITQQVYIVVRGARIRASQQFTPTPHSAITRALTTLSTRPVTVTLTSEPPPIVSLHQGAAAPSVDVTRLAGVKGALLQLSYADCGFPSYSTAGWDTTKLHITPGCAPVESWHLRVAWLNHPVAAIDYLTPATTPTPTPMALPTATVAPTTTPISTGPSFNELFHRASVAMMAVHSLHSEGKPPQSFVSVWLPYPWPNSSGQTSPEPQGQRI